MSITSPDRRHRSRRVPLRDHARTWSPAAGFAGPARIPGSAATDRAPGHAVMRPVTGSHRSRVRLRREPGRVASCCRLRSPWLIPPGYPRSSSQPITLRDPDGVPHYSYRGVVAESLHVAVTSPHLFLWRRGVVRRPCAVETSSTRSSAPISRHSWRSCARPGSRSKPRVTSPPRRCCTRWRRGRPPRTRGPGSAVSPRLLDAPGKRVDWAPVADPRDDEKLAALVEQHGDLIELLATLPGLQRTVLAWSLDGFTPAEIAQALRVDPATVRSNLRHVRERLRRHRAAPPDDQRDRGR